MRKLLNNYGMVLVLLGLCVIFSILTLKQQIPAGKAAVTEVSAQIIQDCEPNDVILAVGAFNRESARFAEAVSASLQENGFSCVQVVTGRPHDLRATLDRLQAAGQTPAALATTGSVLNWRILDLIPDDYPAFAHCRIISPRSYWWPDFLKQSNLLAVVDRIVVIAINDPSALGAHAAVVKAGKTDQIHIVGFDASPADKQAVFTKQLYDSPRQFPRKMAQGTVTAFVTYLEGEALSETIFIPSSSALAEPTGSNERLGVSVLAFGHAE